VNEIKKIKSEINQLRKEVSGIRQSEEDISTIGMDQITKLNKEFKSEVKQLKGEIRVLKKDVAFVKDNKNAKNDDNISYEPQSNDTSAKNNGNIHTQLKHESLTPIIESFVNSEEKSEPPSENTENKCNREEVEMIGLIENGHTPKFEKLAYKNQDTKHFNDDHIRCLVFADSSQESSDFQESEEDKVKITTANFPHI